MQNTPKEWTQSCAYKYLRLKTSILASIIDLEILETHVRKDNKKLLSDAIKRLKEAINTTENK